MKNKILNRLKRTICGFATILTCFSLFSFTPTYLVKKDTVVNSFKLKTVIIDAGHGVKPTNPAPGHYSPGAGGSFSNERNVTLAIALKLQKAIEKDVEGVKAVLTRTTQEDVSFERRAEIANQNKGNLFISIHCNSLSDRVVRERVSTKRGKAVYKSVRVPDRSGKGVLMLVYGLHRSREEQNAIKNNQVEDESGIEGGALDPNDPIVVILTDAYMRKFRKQSIKIANLINDEIVGTNGRRSEGLREQGLYVLCHSAMPSVLFETGYINNPEDEEYLNSEEGQTEIVNSIVRAINKYKVQMEQVTAN
ncbi:N-acetylmuramoyl-L-alanine amidase [Mucilaginibacter sp. RB4R14]|uniref:N-acetylmuramoyl-L-alanine amidase family protein n=1 Tax=Mucilaginibacter aurantiaciroseus TaxID=2949308 RepID=UPI002090E663|nr:N-acetylmuramoyl-L-alanine amidase [Mucilaginibacter aurantiaciroseus]MCO5935068.1 N-acetylmuramoyl-L-alanine amidase [Mucilaginibacter aurantiaciroseus]